MSDFDVFTSSETALDPEAIYDESWHDFRTIVCQHCGHTISVPIYCGNRFCPVCSQPRLARVRARINFLISKTQRRKGYGFKHLTLTIPSSHNLPGMLSELVRSFRRLRQRKLFKAAVVGGAFVLEATEGEHGYHSHIHAILYSRFIPFIDLLELWRRCSPGRGVFIQSIPTSKIVHYLTKYVSKPSGSIVTPSIVANALSSRRLFTVFGSWFKLNADFKPEKKACPQCGHACWMPIDIFYQQIHGRTTLYAPP